MTIITRYISKAFLKLFALTFLAFIMLYLLVDFFEKIDNFIEVGATEYAFSYFMYKLPFVGAQMAPIAVLMSTIIALGIFSRNCEIIAMKANGISLCRISAPFIAIALMITVMTFVASEFIVPYANREANTIWRTKVKNKPTELVYKSEQLWYKGKDVIYNIQTLNAETRTLQGIVINQFDRDFRLVRRIQARSATWNKGQWRFRDGIIKEADSSGSYKITLFLERTFDLVETPDDFIKEAKYSDEMGFCDLRQYAQKIISEGYDASRYLVDMHTKLSFPFICVIMSLIGIPLALRKEKGVGTAAAIGISLGIIILYLVTFVVAQTFGYTRVVPPIVAAWFANILFGSIGVFLLLNTRQ